MFSIFNQYTGKLVFFDSRFVLMYSQVISDVQTLRIVDYSVGHTGSVHDSYAFQGTHTFREHAHLLRPREWIWADTAYPIQPWCIAPYKKPTRGELSSQQKDFNYNISKIRIRSEHAIGLLKGRWQSLHKLRIQICNNQRHLFAIAWIRTCIILHNLTIDYQEAWSDSEGSGGDFYEPDTPTVVGDDYEGGRYAWLPQPIPVQDGGELFRRYLVDTMPINSRR